MKVDTRDQSFSFVKKMLAVTISNITHLRSMFPEEAYATTQIGHVKLPLRIIKERISCICENSSLDPLMLLCNPSRIL